MAGSRSARSLVTLTKRADFVAASRAARSSTAAFTLQARRRDGEDSPPRVGFTCSKKVGNAVARNRAKRRLRALARLILEPKARPGWDYVLVGRAQTTAHTPFATLQADLDAALDKVHRVRAPRP